MNLIINSLQTGFQKIILTKLPPMWRFFHHYLLYLFITQNIIEGKAKIYSTSLVAIKSNTLFMVGLDEKKSRKKENR